MTERGRMTAQTPEPSVLIGTCVECEHWFPMDHENDSCPYDITEDRSHTITVYVQLDRVISYRVGQSYAFSRSKQS